MSGHSKWHNIQKTKGAQDAKRAAAFTKIAKELIVAVKEGGGITDPANNSRLATVITKAKAANMPNDNIKRCLEKAAGAGGGDNYETITYEGYGPGGVAVIVETMTDNRNRTAGSMRHHFDKYGGNLGASGCVSWSFDKKGVLVIDNEEGDYDEDTITQQEEEPDILKVDDVTWKISGTAELSDVEETGETFAENALLKARSGCKESGLPCIADDSGLAVDYLDGAPGVYSARYGGGNLTDEEKGEAVSKIAMLADRMKKENKKM